MHSLSTIVVRLAALGSLFFACMVPVTPLSGQAAPSSAPDPPKLEFVWEEIVTLGPSSPVGATPRGKRNIVPITGGTFEGPHIKGKILPGGWDWQLNSGGCSSIHADYFLETNDGAIINVLNKGTMCMDSSGKPQRTLTTPVFEAPNGPYSWLNGGVYVGTIEGATADGKPAVRIRFYQAL